MKIQNEKSGIKSQYQTESNQFSSLASPLEYNTKQSQILNIHQINQQQQDESSLLVQVNNEGKDIELNNNLLDSNNSNLKKSEVILNLKQTLSYRNLLREQHELISNNTTSTTCQIEKHQSFQQIPQSLQQKQSFSENSQNYQDNPQICSQNPQSSIFGQISNSSGMTQQFECKNKVVNQYIQQQELEELRQIAINEQEKFKRKLENRDESLKKVIQKYNKIFEQSFSILENYETNKLVLQYFRRDFEQIQSDLKQCFNNMDSICLQQIKNIDAIIQYQDKGSLLKLKSLEEYLDVKQKDYDEIESLNTKQLQILHNLQGDITKKNTYIDLLSKQLEEKDQMILSSQQKIKELIQIINDLQVSKLDKCLNCESDKSIQKILHKPYTDLNEKLQNNNLHKQSSMMNNKSLISISNQPLIRQNDKSLTQSKEHQIKTKIIPTFSPSKIKESIIKEKENKVISPSEKTIYSYRYSNKTHSPNQIEQSIISNISNNSNNKAKILKTTQLTNKVNQQLFDKIHDISNEDTLVCTDKTNQTSQILQNTFIMSTPIKKPTQDQMVKTDQIINSGKSCSKERIDQQYSYDNIQFKLSKTHNQNDQGLIRSKSYQRFTNSMLNSQSSLVFPIYMHQQLSPKRNFSKNIASEVKNNSFLESNQKQNQKNNIQILSEIQNTYISPIKSEYSPVAKGGKILIKTPQPTKISTQSRDDLIKQVCDPEPPSLERALSKSVERDNNNQRKQDDVNKQKIIDSKINQHEKLTIKQEKIYEKIIPSKVGNITIQSRIICNSLSKQS